MIEKKPVGVILFNRKGEILFGKRSDGKGWCFPGGGTEPGEESIQAAQRELYEETGLKVEKYELAFLGACQTFDVTKGVNTFRISNIYYYVKLIDDSDVQTTEELVEYCWMTAKEAQKKLKLFFPTAQALSTFYDTIVKILYKSAFSERESHGFKESNFSTT